MTRRTAVITTSWDDGHVLDARLAALLKKYNLPATFYIAPKNREFSQSELLSRKEIKALAKDFEIGSHTMTHPVLTTLSDKEIEKELLQLWYVRDDEGTWILEVTRHCDTGLF